MRSARSVSCSCAAGGELTDRVVGWSLLLVAAACAGVVALAAVYVAMVPNA
ncbi:MAG: hypothetical protein ACJ8GO_00215 [Ramlibacter sp.]